MRNPGSSLPANLAGGPPGPYDFWRENVKGGWATALVLAFLLLWQLSRALSRRRTPSSAVLEPARATGGDSSAGISKIITDADLRNLISNLEGKLSEEERWDDVIDKRNGLLSYNAKCCRPKDGPLKYLSVTTFEKCSPEMLRDFYLDNQYRKEWDKTLVEHEQLEIDKISGTEIGRTIKKFPLLTPREYILAWRVWQGRDNTFYCSIKDCDHPLASRKRKYVRVGFFRSGWRIRKVPGRDACEIKMVHQEDAGLNVQMEKLVFSKGIWSYVCKMNNALHQYSSHAPITSPATALRLVQVPPDLERGSETTHCNTAIGRPLGEEVAENNFSKKPSKKWIAQGLLVLGGVVFLSRGHSTLGAQLAMACILKKLMKHGEASNQAELPRGGRRPPRNLKDR